MGVNAPWLVVILVPMAVFYLHTMNHYRASVRELQRLQSKGASPIYAMFSETLDGIVTSRAYSRERQLEGLNLALLDTLIRPSYLNSCCGQWLNLRLVTMGALVSASTAALAVFEFGQGEAPSKAGLVGFTLVHALSISDMLNGFINTFTACENNLVAMERLNRFRELEQEAPMELPGDPAGDWPPRGAIDFDNVWMAYRPG